MNHLKSTLERAFELARMGKYSGMSDLRLHLKSEGYSPREIDGPALGRQLREIMRKSKDAAQS